MLICHLVPPLVASCELISGYSACVARNYIPTTARSEIEGLLKAKFEGSYGDEENLARRDNGSDGLVDHVGGEEFEFRLFSSTCMADSKPPKIVAISHKC